jgi:alpha-beta hydrolase superfamily lysophospholipase
MEQSAGNFDGINGCKLYYKTWLPEAHPKAALLIVHGAGEHIDRYQNVVSALLESGYALVGYDQRGHGRSEGQRGHINSWKEYRGDLGEFIKMARQMLPDTPQFILGHSLGSLIVLDYLIYHPEGLSGAILSGTSLDPVDAAPPVQKFLAQLLSGIYPTFTLKIPLPGNSLSRDPQVSQAYDQDPMVFWNRTARWGAESLKAIERIKNNSDQIKTPLLFLHGEKDPLVSAEGAQRYFERLSTADKTMRIYPDTLHEAHNDLDHQAVIADMQQWIASHL